MVQSALNAASCVAIQAIELIWPDPGNCGSLSTPSAGVKLGVLSARVSCRVGLEIDGLRGAGGAVRPREQGLVADIMAGVGARNIGSRQRNGNNAGLGQRHHLAGVGYAILVKVLPDPERAEHRIGRVDLAVAIGVESFQNGKAVLRGRAEEFGHIVGDTIPVGIPNQNSVIGRYPASAFRKAVTIIVEMDSGAGEWGEFHTVAVEIEDERVVEDVEKW